MQWKGPFIVIEKKNAMDYRIDLGHRQQTFHANMLKKYHRRPKEVIAAAIAVIEDEVMDEYAEEDKVLPNNEDLLQLPRLIAKETVKDVKVNGEFYNEQKWQVNQILNDYSDVLTDIPGHTNLCKHRIKVTDNKPIQCKPYPIPHAIRDEVQQDIETMQKLGVVTKCSNSPYAFPLVCVSQIKHLEVAST